MTILERSDEEYIEWIGDWLGRAEEYRDRRGTYPVMVGKAHVQRLYEIARKNT